jgi:thioredoxin 1
MLKIMYFTAPWCGPCKIMSPMVDEVVRETGVIVEKVNADDSPKIAELYSVSGVPTLIFIKDGNPIHRHTGIMPKPKLLNLIHTL